MSRLYDELISSVNTWILFEEEITTLLSKLKIIPKKLKSCHKIEEKLKLQKAFTLSYRPSVT